MKFKFGQRVKVIEGFYEGSEGVVTHYFKGSLMRLYLNVEFRPYYRVLLDLEETAGKTVYQRSLNFYEEELALINK